MFVTLKCSADLAAWLGAEPYQPGLGVPSGSIFLFCEDDGSTWYWPLDPLLVGYIEVSG
ncbi:hypothetical protein [Bosea sp. BK604]|uniref:hypothetical protein n=1 Tax=Bosea sp. BK604 TaxID=2512180 RepID=UPI001404BF87|nr:hypothetical protein [Bosea sp. BK604]